MQTGGLCCSSDEDTARSPCSQDGRNSLDTQHAQTFLCPMASNCGPSTIYAKSKTRTYSILPTTLKEKANFCNHALLFDIDAGSRDVLTVEFKQAHPDTKVHYAYGPSFDSVINGGVLSDVRGQQITIMFPNNLYFSIEHVLDGDYEFSFSFFYEDNEPESDESLLSIFKIEDAQTDGKSLMLY